MAMDAVPEIVFNEHEGGEMKLGDVVVLNPFYVGDVLDYDSIVKFYVLDPDENYVTATNGTLLDGENVDYSKEYSIIIEKAGMYNVCMEVSDTMGNMQLYAYGISAVDRTAPTITLIQGETECKVGDMLAIWEAKATDALGNELDLIVYAYGPDGLLRQIENGYFYGEKEGVYVVYYQVYDENENVAIERYEITVG